MEVKIDIFDDLIEKVFNMTPEEFERERIESHKHEIKLLIGEYDDTDPWRFVKRALILRRIGFHTRKIEELAGDLKTRRTEHKKAKPDIA